MFRLVGASDAIREAVPHELVPLFLAVTALGSAKILVIGLAVAYWNWEAEREELLAVIAVAFVALSVTLSLKHAFALPRPPGELQRYPIDPSPHGFPSGHAIAATVVYGGALLATERYRHLRTALGVGALVVAIGLSRVVLGVHYLGDVLAGFAVGAVALAVVSFAVRADRGATVTFLVAAVASVPALFVASGDPDVALALGGGVGGALGSLFASRRAFRSPTERVLFNLLGVAFILAGIATAEIAEPLFVAAVAVNLVLAFGIVALPSGLARVDSLPFAPTSSHR